MMDEMSLVEQQLDGDEGGVRMRPRKRNTAQVRKQVQRLSRDLEQLQKENEDFSV